MGRVDDVDDIPTSDRGWKTRELKSGFNGFDWWATWNIRYFTLGVSWHFGEWSGPVGYENGAWLGWHFVVCLLFWGCRLDWVSKWVPNDETDPIPRIRPQGSRPKRRRSLAARAEDLLNDKGQTEPPKSAQ